MTDSKDWPEVLRQSFEAAVVRAAEEAGLGRLDFGTAAIRLSSASMNAIVESFRQQSSELERQRGEQ